MSIDTLFILILVVASILALVGLERHSRKNRARDRENSANAPADTKRVE